MTDLSDVRPGRAEGDSWDITESVGATALGVAASRAAETAQPEPLIRDEFAFLLVAAAGPAWAQLAGSEPHWIGDNPEAHRIHVMARNYQAVRTHYFDDYFTEVTHDGIRQVVILAAGLDSRAFRLDWPAGTTVYEIDQPKVLEYKTATLGAHGAVARAQHVPVPIDLREDWPAALIEAGFDPEQPTAWLAEGLLPYLPGEAQDRLFELVGAHSAPGSRLAVEDFTMDPARYTPEKRAARRARGEHMRASLGLDIDADALMYTGDERADAAEWLAAHGWDVNAVDSADEMARLGRPAGVDELAEIGLDSVLLRARLDGETR
ncbi:class I SAM-dependent methyltransferase [Mycolicibacterium nivoides]|uniref:S-adenosyl-L-methionine-dependent methyltransferase n=1 Tax=Mycolicibacterium nivoides TaxID=2487344 RepID=A0ABW9LA77_9MYCO|nr:class I SAM-dependent methyltransferase [Mycolicibacterium nivoides]MBN3511663.1 class I SAM-dependent methyltransferase [Mycolicibacterium septicum]SEQ96419.1 methyltransferase, TIGR00027 family [Mycobacterium sp. 88mf]SFF95330.1 methyltransferase, TIGR00027 family [Mycobacterium sp. 455mf]